MRQLLSFMQTKKARFPVLGYPVSAKAPAPFIDSALFDAGKIYSSQIQANRTPATG